MIHPIEPNAVSSKEIICSKLNHCERLSLNNYCVSCHFRNGAKNSQYTNNYSSYSSQSVLQIYAKNYFHRHTQLSKMQMISNIGLNKLTDSCFNENNLFTNEASSSVFSKSKRSFAILNSETENKEFAFNFKKLPDFLSELNDSTLEDEDASYDNTPKNNVANIKACFRKKKKRRRPSITICTSNCRYEAVRRVTTAFGMKEVPEDDDWNFYWTDMSISAERAKEMKRFQRINHFPGMLEICRKDLLARNLNRMQKNFPKEYSFFPKSWCLPADLSDAINYSKTHKNKMFIIKPECGSQGRGIYLTKTLKDISSADKLICQLYISKPYLIDGYKFDMRVYTLISSCDPLRIFVYNEGLVRFATSRYADPNTHNTTNVYMHLTNYALNKHSRTFVYDDELGSKRKISTLNRHLESQGVNVETLWQTIDQIIVKTIISAFPIIKHSYRACFPSHDTVQACFEILGFDILLDHNLQPYILEVNHSPSFHTDSQLDRDVKEKLLTDTLSLLNVWQCDKKKVLEEDRRRIKERLLNKHQRNTSESLSNDEKEAVKEKSSWEAQILWEEDNIGNFRRVYPSGDQYVKFFQQPSSSLYLSTTSSRARSDCAKQQRDDIENKKIDLLKKLPTLSKKSKESSDMETSKDAPGENAIGMEDKVNKIRKKKLKPIAIIKKNPKVEIAAYHLYKSVPIVETEERERLAQLARRDFLIRSSGLLEQIYLVMKHSGTLRQQDELKYGLYDKSTRNRNKRVDSIDTENNNNILIPSYTELQQKVYVGDTKHDSDTLNHKHISSKDFQVQCAEARIHMKPEIPSLLKEDSFSKRASKKSQWPAMDGYNVKNNKAHIGRVLCSDVRMHSLEARTTHNDYT